MQSNLFSVESTHDLDRLFDESHKRPVVLFKHSRSCGISAGVYREVAAMGAEVNVIVVQSARPVSDAVATRTGIRHESPQAIVLHDGEAVYHASHYDIEPADIERSVRIALERETPDR